MNKKNTSHNLSVKYTFKIWYYFQKNDVLSKLFV